MAIDSSVRWFHSQMFGSPQIQSPWSGTVVSILDACLINGFNSTVATEIEVSGGVATATFASAHNYEQYAVIHVQGVDGVMSGLNGDWRIKEVPNSVTLTFDATSIPSGNALNVGISLATPGYWERPFYNAAAHTAAYRSTHEDASGAYFRIEDNLSATNQVRVRGYETMSDINTGIRPFPTFAQASETAFQWKRASTTLNSPRQWVLVADHMFFWFFIYHANITPIQATMYHFGDIVRFNPLDIFPCVIVGHNTTTTTGALNAHSWMNINIFNSSSTQGCYWARPMNNEAENPPTYTILGNTKTTSPGAGADFPHPATGGYMFHYPLMVAEPPTGINTIERGFLPGGMQGLTDSLMTLEEDQWRLLHPSLAYPRGIMLIATSVSTGTARSYFGVDIFGPWR